MTKKMWLSIAILSIFVIWSIVAAATITSVGTVSSSANTEELIIGFKNNTAPSLQQAMTAKYGYKVLERNDALNCVLVQVTRDDTLHVINSVAREDFVRYVEPNKRVHALYTPNDPRYLYQWGPQHIKADRAWDTERGNKNVTIAIIDTGIDYTHEDLSTNYVLGGYDWVNNDSDPMDDYGHGTHCAGIAAAIIDNGKGIAGIAQVNLMAEKVLDETGWGTEWNVSQGIVHAADNDVDIISLSLGGYDDAQVEEDACLYAWNHGCLLVAAAGNDNICGIMYPAAYETVIAVGAIYPTDQRCGFSNWGPNLELVAPGVGILSTYYPSNSYATLPGTSMAAPHVAGVAALILSKYPSLTNHEVRDILSHTADDLGSDGFDQYYGYGKVNAMNATNLHAFDTNQSQNPYPSISGIHNGSIMLNQTIIVSKLYTYPCAGTGGHTEYARIWGPSLDVNATWQGYTGDWHNISFNKTFVLYKNETYNYTILTGSYPQIHHNTTLIVQDGEITCTNFTDANGKTYTNWVPAIKLFL